MGRRVVNFTCYSVLHKKWLPPLFDFADENSPAEEHNEDVELTPPLLEEAVNLLLVNKTVMSCILVLQNKRGTEKIKETTTTELPTVIHAPLKVRYLQEKTLFLIFFCILTAPL